MNKHPIVYSDQIVVVENTDCELERQQSADNEPKEEVG